MTTRFRAAVWRGGTGHDIEMAELLPLRPGDVHVRVTAANVNYSDHILLLPENRFPGEHTPQIHGHGGVGIVEEIGPGVTRVAPGDRVILLGTPQCGTCYYCLRGRADQCARLQINGQPHARDSAGAEIIGSGAVGCFAERAVLPEIQLVPVDTDVADRDLAMLSVCFGSGVGAALITAPVAPGATVVAVGLGVSGQAYVQAARAAGAAMIIGVDPLADRRDVALANGATHVVDPGAGDPVQAVHALTGDMGGLQGAGGEFVFEAAGTVAGMQQAFAMTRQTCDLVLSSVPARMMDEVAFSAVAIACMGKRIHANQYGGFNILRDIPRAIRMIETGALNPSALPGKTYRLEEVNAAIADVAAFNVLGATITF